MFGSGILYCVPPFYMKFILCLILKDKDTGNLFFLIFFDEFRTYK